MARIADHFDRQEQYEGLKNLEREAKVLRGNVYQWVRTQPPVPPKPDDYKRNIGLKTEPTGRLAFRTTLILLAQAASIVGQFRRAATHPEERENNIWFWFIILFDVFIPIASVLEARYQKDNLKDAFNSANAELQQLKFIAAHGQGSQSAAAAAFEREAKERRSPIVQADALATEKEKMKLKGEESEQGQPFIKKDPEQPEALLSSASSFNLSRLEVTGSSTLSSSSEALKSVQSSDDQPSLEHTNKPIAQKFAMDNKPSILEVKQEGGYVIRFLSSKEEYFSILRRAEIAAGYPVNSQEYSEAEELYQEALKKFEEFVRANNIQEDCEEVELAYATIKMRIGNMRYHLALKNGTSGILDEAEKYLIRAQSVFRKHGIINRDLNKLCKQCTRAREDRDDERAAHSMS